MRIAIVSSYFPSSAQPYQGHSAHQTARALRKLAEVKAFVPLAVYPQLLRPKSFPYFRADHSYAPLGVPTQYIEYPAVPVVSRVLNGYACCRRLLPHLKEWKPDIVLSYWLYPVGYAAAAAAKTIGVPSVVCAIGTDLRRIPDRITLQLTKKTLRDASFVVTVSEELRQQAIRLGVAAEGVRSILNGCDRSIFRLCDRGEARAALGVDGNSELLLYAGRLDPNKGLKELLTAVSRLRIARPNLRLAILGEGIIKDELLQMAHTMGMVGSVTFTGPLPSIKVAQWMTAADMFCLPSYSEGCPNVVIEALASGRPVVACRVGGIPELVTRDSGILVPPRDPEQLTEALREALERHWDERGIAQRFARSWDDVAQDTWNVCESVLLEHRSPADRLSAHLPGAIA